MDTLYSYNDWRDYALIHERKSQWTDENGRNTPAYNHKYYEEHREEIIKRVTENRRNSRTSNRTDYEKNGYDWKNKNARGKAYANDDERRKTYLDLANDNAFSDNEDEDSLWKDADDSLKGNKEYSEDVLENIRKNNENARNNIRKLQETVQNYVKANSEKLTTDQIAKLYQDLEQQTALERKRVIDISSKEGKAYVDGLLKGGGKSSKPSGSVSTESSSKSSKSSSKSSSSTSSKSSSQSSKTSPSSQPTSVTAEPAGSSDPTKDTGKKDKKKTAIDELVDKYGDLTPEERKKMKHSEEYTYNDWRYYLQHKESKWEWKDGKNSSEYNHWYYLTHPEKWGKAIGDAAKSVKKAYDDWGTKPRVMDDGRVLMPDGTYRSKEWYDSHYDEDGNEISTPKSEKKSDVAVSVNLPNPSTASSSDDDYYVDDKGMYRTKDAAYYQKEAEEEKRKKEEEEERKNRNSRNVATAVKVMDYMSHSEDYAYNDWRYYLQHRAEKGKSKYDWSSGKNPPDYNHDYWEKNKEEILAQRAKKAGKSVSDVEKENVRDFGGKGVGYKSRSKDGKSYEDRDDWSSELSDDEKKNIEAHNKQIDENIANLKKTVEDYIAANKDKLGEEGIKKLRDNLQAQIDIANEQRISTKNSDDRDYIMGLRKQSESGSSSDSDSSTGSSSGSRSSSKSSSSSSKPAKDKTPKGSEAAKSVSAEQQRKEQQASRKANNADQAAMKSTVDSYKNDKSRIKNEDGAAQDFGEFLAEFGENGGSNLSGQAAIDAWVGFRKELGLSTTQRQIERQSRILGDRMTRNE